VGMMNSRFRKRALPMDAATNRRNACT